MEENSTENLQKLIDEIEENSDVAVFNPATRALLESKGYKFPQPTPITLDDFIDNIRKNASQIASELPQAPVIAAPGISSLYDEIRKAVILGLNGAAITLSGVLVEYMLKFAAYKVEMGGFAKYDPVKLDEFENMNFSDAIGRAAKNRLLTREDKKNLSRFRDNIRNPYNHYNIKRITSEYEGPIQILNTKTGKIEVVRKKAVDDTVLQELIKPKADADHVLKVFIFADSVVKVLWTKLQIMFEDKN